MTATTYFSREFALKRLHSLLGLGVVLFLTEHLITNSQAALFLGDNGEGFVSMVNWIKSLPYLPVIEISLIGLPILLHGGMGIHYLFTSRPNVFGGGATPRMRYERNWAYTLQRASSWILLIGIIAHVGYLRFYKYPVEVEAGKQTFYFTRISMDNGLYTLCDRLDVTLYGPKQIEEIKAPDVAFPVDTLYGMQTEYKKVLDREMSELQQKEIQREYIEGLKARGVDKTQVIAESTNFGAVTLLNVRDSFKSIGISVLYTIFVLAAVFHAYNGLWTFLITWGAMIGMGSQRAAVKMCYGIMALIGALGLFGIWGTFWLNLRY